MRGFTVNRFFFLGEARCAIELLICRKERQKRRAEINKRVLTVADLAPLPLYFNLSLEEALLTRCIKSENMYYTHSSSYTFITTAGTTARGYRFTHVFFPQSLIHNHCV